MKGTKLQTIFRWLFYVGGMVVLALGITLNTKTGLGVSPIISVSYSVSTIFHLNFGNMTMILYTLFVVAEFVLKGKNAKLYDALQLIVSLLFTRVMNLFNDNINLAFPELWQNILLLMVAIFLTGLGIVMTVSMKLIPNPGDGIVQAIADKIKKSMGFTKNAFDLSMVAITCVLGLVAVGKVVGIGLGTVLAMLLTGRAVALCTVLFKKPMLKLSGL